MNRLVAVVLAIAVPATALADGPVLTPQYEQPVRTQLTLVEPAPTPLYARGYVWAIAGGTTAAIVVAVVIGVLASSTPRSTPINKSDFPCGSGMSCDGWVNPPPR